MEYQNLLLTIADTGIATITINRPDKLNALNRATVQEIEDAFQEAINNTSVKGILLTGAGNKAFVAGADISEFTSLNPQEGRQLAEKGHAVFRLIETSPKPVVAAINGFALGGGCELAMACHLRIAADTAQLGQPEAKLGIIPGYAGTQRLVQLVGKAKALEFMLTCDMIPATEAYRLGLVNEIVPQEEVINRATTILTKIIRQAPVAIQGIIKAVNAYYDYDVDGFQAEIAAFADCVATTDFKEGATAFLEKRRPNFEGK